MSILVCNPYSLCAFVFRFLFLGLSLLVEAIKYESCDFYCELGLHKIYGPTHCSVSRSGRDEEISFLFCVRKKDLSLRFTIFGA
jgi:hypothetical protein